MLVFNLVVSVISLMTITLSSSSLFAQQYPNKPIRIVTTQPGRGELISPAGLMAQGLPATLGQPIVV